MKTLRKTDSEICKLIHQELERQRNNIELIASENFTSAAVLEAAGSVLTNKYAEGYPSKRWYGGCEYVDGVESLAIERAKKIFGAEHVNVQPHSGSQANMAVYFALLQPGDTVLAMDLACGGHLTHGLKHNFSGKLFNVIPYGLNKDTEMLDYDEIESLAKKHKPRMILAGASAYSRIMDFKRFREIADRIGAYLFVDMAHIAGLVAAGLHPNPVDHAHVVSTTTHKTLRGPRGGMILCKQEFAKKIDMEVFPGEQGGPLMHIIAAKAVALKEADTEEFRQYQRQIVKNTKAFANALNKSGYRIVSGGTDNHLFLVDLTSKNITGKDASELLDKIHVTVNKNLIPFDKNSSAFTSGVRLGTPAVTTRGMKEKDMEKIAQIITSAIKYRDDQDKLLECKKDVEKLIKKFPLYPELTY